MRLIVPLFLLATCLPAAFAEDGVSATEILIGQCAAMSGPAAGLGTGMRDGLLACFAEINAAGGIGGRRLRLAPVDDGYEPERCISGTLALLNDQHVFALSGYVGTPTTKVVVPIITERKVPLIGAFTGAAVLRHQDNSLEPHRYVFNIRAGYDDETEALIDHLTQDCQAKRFAVFYQNDAFGLAGLNGVEHALAHRQMTLVAKGSFERNTVAIKSGLGDVMDGEPDAVVMVGPYKPITAFLAASKAAGLSARLATISFVGTDNLLSEAGADADGVIISQVVPSPADTSIPAIIHYRTALATYLPKAKPGYVSLEGYVSGLVLVAALERVAASPTREGLVDACEHFKQFDLGGMTVAFSPQQHQASSTVYLTVVKQGAAVPVERLAP